MLQTQDEARRIRAEYAKRDQDPDRAALYSSSNPGASFLYVQRKRHVLATLRRHGIHSLRDRAILEVGCGKGNVLRELMALEADVSRLHGIDLLEWRLHEALSDASDLPLVCADSQALPYPNGAFDLVLQFTVFTSILNFEMKRVMAREMMRVLKPDGLILWYDFWINPMNACTKGIRPPEIRMLFSNCRFEFNRVTLAPPVARRLAGRAWGVCLLLERLQLFNTHYLAAIWPQSERTHSADAAPVWAT